MYRWEKELKKLIHDEENDYLLSEKGHHALLRLEDKGLIKVLRADNVPVHVTCTEAGLVYFDERREIRWERWLDRLWGFLAGLIIGSAAVWLPVVIEAIKGPAG